MIWGEQRWKDEIRCGRHSGFAWCCLLWYILPWKLILKYAKWDESYTWYHKWMDRRQPKNKMPDISIKTESDPTAKYGFRVISWRKRDVSDWGMIPCPLHLLLRRRTQVYTCFCGGQWKPEVKTSLLAAHPELCVK